MSDSNSNGNHEHTDNEKQRRRGKDAFAQAKVVNKRLREERRAARKQRPQRDAGKYRKVWAVIRHQYSGNPQGQAARFLSDCPIPAAIGKRRWIGEEHLGEFGRVLLCLPDDLRAAGVPIRNLDEVSLKHVPPLVKLWEARALSEGYIADQLSILRRFLALIGKPTAIPTDDVLREHLRSKGVVAGTIGRCAIATLPKGWRDLGFDPDAIIQAVMEESEVMGVHLEMMGAYGLRCTECVQCQPRLSDKGDFLIISRGTKGGKTRMVMFSSNPEKRAWQREVLDRAIAIADKNPKGELAEPGLTLKQMKGRQRYVFEKFGLTKNGLGIVPHGQRHQFATDLFLELTGLPAPVLGLLPAEVYKSKWVIVRNAYLEISRQMGHERVSITGAYGGSPNKLRKSQHKRIGALLAQVAAADGALEAAGVTDCWILGRAAFGTEMLPGEHLQVAVRLSETSRDLTQRMASVRKALEDAVATRVTLTLWLEDGVPAEALETMYTPGTRLDLGKTLKPSDGHGSAA
ncbi:MAG: integrase domain-containing protein [Ramlibacter sp.]|nr:integrase domain-containing protein [Ramlibacter sp.]